MNPDPVPAHDADLALATACAAGDEQAWERFIREYRPVLHRAADAMAPAGGAREIADALFAELYGLREREGERQSLFRYFQGRSSLATWLRAVLAQRYVDCIRASRRTEPLPDEESMAPSHSGALGSASPEEPRCRAAVRDSLESALAGLHARDRLRLRCYYTQELTLAAIGKMFGEHEATASRHLARVRKDLRLAVEGRMRDAHGYADAPLADCLQLVMSDAGDLDLGTLLARTPGEIVQNERDPRVQYPD
ncbi:MAG: sigma-70 family RNA polymerase sigma factor [Vicinamibacterales bacterium]